MERNRNWTFLLYPDSMPDNSIDILKSWHIPVIISPLHCAESVEDNYKPHFHIIVHFDNNKSFNQVVSLTSQLGVKYIQVVHSMRGLVQYFVHLNNPDKPTYFISDIGTIGSVDIFSYFTAPSDDYVKIAEEITSWVMDNMVSEWSVLYVYALSEYRYTWFPYLTNCNCANIYRLLSSNRYGRKKEDN